METEEGYAEKLCAKLFHASMKVLRSICIIFAYNYKIRLL